MARPLTFWFDFASTYSYLSALRVEETAKAAGIELIWRPFALGPIFAAQGWDSSPFNIYPAKGRAMWRDMARIAADRGLAYRPPADPSRFPQNSMLAARLAIVALDHPQGPLFCREIFRAQFERGQDIAAAAILADCLDRAGLPANLAAEAESEANRPRLREATERAVAAGIFGAPSFTLGEELFWGDDRLEQALIWAQR
ncbi:MAG TPA: disulfide bond formation protein DsbA [Rhodobacteraceae bacterium]|nr:disulfide bond formation protein DsbA [Paracoccaceae bacterium]